MLKQAQPVEHLPGFNAGCCSVQDLASQYIAELLDIQSGQRILDACAAPGGKTSHILETYPDIAALTALDQDPERLQKVEATVSRLGLSQSVLTLIAADASQPEQWWDGELFDRILLDAPCSGTGVIRRHPDIKMLRQRGDIGLYVIRQRQLISALWPLLKPGGRLLYSTCSILPDENEGIMEHFSQHHPEANFLPITIKPGIPQKFGRQLLPQTLSHDGFITHY